MDLAINVRVEISLKIVVVDLFNIEQKFQKIDRFFVLKVQKLKKKKINTVCLQVLEGNKNASGDLPLTDIHRLPDWQSHNKLPCQQ